MPLVRRTRAILRSAEFGFFGVTVATRVHTPRRCGADTRCLRPWPDLRPGVVTFFCGRLRPLRMSWLVLGTAANSSGASLAGSLAAPVAGRVRMQKKLDISDVFDRTFKVYADQASLLIPAALLVFLPVAV